MAPAGSSSKLIMERSPCRSTVICAAATLAKLVLPSTLAAGPVGRTRDDKHRRRYVIVYGNKCVCKHGFVMIDDVMQCIHRYGPLTRKASARLGYHLVPSG